MKLQHKSIAHQLIRFVIVMIVAQAVLLTGLMVLGGVLKQAEENAYQSFRDKVVNRNDTIQREMKNRWTNIDLFVSAISKQFKSTADTKDFLTKSTSHLIDMLRSTEATGVFVVLTSLETSENSASALYLRDYDPLLNDLSNDDIYMAVGPFDVAKQYKLPLDENWQIVLDNEQLKMPFVQKPLSNALKTLDSKHVGYWSPPFQLSPSDPSVIAFSMPLLDENTTVRGVIGVEISIHYLLQNLPSTDIQLKDALGYLIAYQGHPDEPLVPLIMQGALQKRMIPADIPLTYEIMNEDFNIAALKQHNSKEPIFACIEKIGLYYGNTPYANESWYLVGLIGEETLLSYVLNIQRILLFSLLISLFIGVLGAVLISYQFSKPIVKLSNQIKDNTLTTFEPTGLSELDTLMSAMTLSNQALLESASRVSRIIDLVSEPIGAFEWQEIGDDVFATDQLWSLLSIEEGSKLSLRKRIEDILKHPEADEEDVYSFEDKWLRVSLQKRASSTLGVVIDVTREILEKRTMKMDRDLDPLTKLLNRKAFQWQFESWYSETSHTYAALVMFDLDNLKGVNDTYGHKWGDAYILSCVDVLNQFASQHAYALGRQSGDEFVALLEGYTSLDDLRKIMDDFFVNLSKERIIYPDGKSAQLTLSAGIVYIKDKEHTYEALLHYADEALYDAKRHKKGHYKENLSIV